MPTSENEMLNGWDTCRLVAQRPTLCFANPVHVGFGFGGRVQGNLWKDTVLRRWPWGLHRGSYPTHLSGTLLYGLDLLFRKVSTLKKG